LERAAWVRSVAVSRDEWFRGTAWDAETREVFERKLGRARKASRAQYLRIKGLGLTGSSDPDVRQAGRQLLRRVVDDHPDDPLQVTMALAELADSLAADGDLAQAAEHYQRALAGGDLVQTYAELGLIEVILRAGWVDRYDEASELLLASQASSDPFPANRFRWNLAGARLASRIGEAADAMELAKIALRCLDQTESPFPRHRGLGLASADDETVHELRRLANAGR
jgi:tetratricopeptide (TPR) repeat protein